MPRPLRPLPKVLVTVVAAVLAVGCTTITGKSLGQNLGDARITAVVKSRLVAERVATLTKIDVDTNLGTVYLHGVVNDAVLKQRASDVAARVADVREVVNNVVVKPR